MFLEQHLARIQHPESGIEPVLSAPRAATTSTQTTEPQTELAADAVRKEEFVKRRGWWLLFAAGISALVCGALGSSSQLNMEVLVFVSIATLPVALFVFMVYTLRCLARSAKPGATNLSSTTGRYFPTPIGFTTALLSVLAAASATAMFFRVSSQSFHYSFMNTFLAVGPVAIGICVLAVIGLRSVRYPGESENSIAAIGFASACLLATAYTPFFLASRSPLKLATVLFAFAVWLVAAGTAVVLLRRSLLQRPNAQFLMAEARDSASKHYLILGGSLLTALMVWMLIAGLDGGVVPGILTHYAAEVCFTTLAIGAILMAAGVVLRNSDKSTGGTSGVLAYLLLGPIGLLLWLSQRNRELRTELRQIREGTAPEPQPCVEIPRESSAGRIGRFLAQLGCLLLFYPMTYVIRLELLGPLYKSIRQGMILAALVGLSAAALGLFVRKFQDEQPSLQRPLRLWRTPLALLVLAAAIGIAISTQGIL